MCVCVFIKLHITAQSGLVILVIRVCVCVCVGMCVFIKLQCVGVRVFDQVVSHAVIDVFHKHS